MLLHLPLSQLSRSTSTQILKHSFKPLHFFSSTKMSSTSAFPLRASPTSIASLSLYSTCEISDALLKCSISSGGYIPDLEIFSEGTKSSEGSNWNAVGEAFTVKMVDQKDLEAPKLDGHFVDLAPKGCMIVISSPPHVKSASFGGLLGLGASVKGVQGIIVDGRCRDLAELRAMELPVMARGHSTLGQSPFTRASEIQIPLVIEPQFPSSTSSWPSITVHPYDIILADLDGVIVVRPENLEAVLGIAKKGKEIDELCRSDIESGRPVGETFKDRRGGGTKK